MKYLCLHLPTLLIHAYCPYFHVHIRVELKKTPENTMVKKRDKQGCTEDLHRKLKIEQHESHEDRS